MLVVSGLSIDLLLDYFEDGVPDTLGLGESASHLRIADDEDVVDSGVEDVASLVLEGDDGNVTHLLDDRLDCTHSAEIVTESNDGLVADGQLEMSVDGVLFEVVHNGVTDTDGWVRVSDGSGIVGHNVGDLVCTDLDSHDLADLVVSFLLLDLQQSKPSLLVVEKSVKIASLWDADNVCGKKKGYP